MFYVFNYLYIVKTKNNSGKMKNNSGKMKKFSELNNNDKKIDQVTNKKDFISSLIEETLTIVDGEIQGKNTLVKTLNKIMEMNDSKTKIQILESVKLNAYRGGFDFNKITEAIEAEKAKLNLPVVEETTLVSDVNPGDIIASRGNDKIVSVSESLNTKTKKIELTAEELEDAEELEESKTYKLKDGRIINVSEDGDFTLETKEISESNDVESIDDFVEYGKKILKKAHGNEYDDLKATEMLNGIYNDKIYGKIDDWGEAIGILKNSLKDDVKESKDGFIDPEVPEEENIMEAVTLDINKEISSLASLYGKILEEHHLENKKEKIEFILDNEKLDNETGPKRKEELENMNDREIDNIYKKIEKDLGLV